jgi:hypothetical protein
MLDSGFRYVPAAQTNVVATWKRFGYTPTPESERRARQQRILGYKTNKPAHGGNDASLEQPGGMRILPSLRKPRNVVLKLAASE